MKACALPIGVSRSFLESVVLTPFAWRWLCFPQSVPMLSAFRLGRINVQHDTSIVMSMVARVRVRVILVALAFAPAIVQLFAIFFLRVLVPIPVCRENDRIFLEAHGTNTWKHMGRSNYF